MRSLHIIANAGTASRRIRGIRSCQSGAPVQHSTHAGGVGGTRGTCRQPDYRAAPLGLVPHWAKEISIGSKLINARCETIHEKSSFRHAIRSRRCIIPASGYFEWAASSSGKLPHYITMRDESPMSLAGIWETWKAPDGKSLETVALLTTRANSMLAAIHDRMPVILHPGEFALWLDRTATDPHKLERLYQPFPSERIQAWPVSKAVNNAAHNSAECIQPLTVPP